MRGTRVALLRNVFPRYVYPKTGQVTNHGGVGMCSFRSFRSNSYLVTVDIAADRAQAVYITDSHQRQSCRADHGMIFAWS